MHLHCARLAAFLVIATHRPTRLTGFTRVIIIYSLGLPPSLPPSSIILLPLPLPYPPLSYKRQVDLLTCAERLADDFWEEHLHAGRLGRLPRKTSAHNYWHERDGRPRQQYQYPLPDTVLHPFPVIRAHSSIPSRQGEFADNTDFQVSSPVCSFKQNFSPFR